jgi:hypothetical protein
MVLAVSACTDQGRIERRENRIEGTWYFDNAFFKGNRALFRKNIYDEYAGDEITFYRDYSCTYFDASTNEFFEGEWWLEMLRTDIAGDTEREYLLDMVFYDYQGREAFAFFSTTTKIGFNNLNFNVFTDYGEYRYKLNKR